MRKQFFILVLVITVIISCGSGPKFSDVTGKEWKLIEVNANGRDIFFDRNTLNREDAGNIFTFSFDAQNISGVGAPNRYSGPYTLGRDQTITLSPMRSTMMAPLKQPEKLKEADFFIYIQNINRWNLVNSNLELYSEAEDGSEVRMVFSL